MISVAFAGLLSGAINTVAGGGSMLTLPALMLAGLPADIANGSNRLATVTQGIAAVHGFHRRGALHLQASRWPIVWTLLGAIAGASTAAIVPAKNLKPIMLGTILVMAIIIAITPARHNDEANESVSINASSMVALILAGFYGGFIQAGIGFVLLGVFNGKMHLSLVRANALKVTCVLVFGLASFAILVFAGKVVWQPAIVLAVGSWLGAKLGVRFATRVSPGALKLVVVLIVCVACAAAWLGIGER
ncbi:MAG: sulfite exporter TauE/SafE family protein [Polyangiales bacterium]